MILIQGLLIGRKGADIDLLRKNLSKLVSKEIFIDIKEIKRPTKT